MTPAPAALMALAMPLRVPFEALIEMVLLLSLSAGVKVLVLAS